MILNHLITQYQSIVRGTDTAYCVHCRSQRKVVKLGYVDHTNSKGPTRRLQGRCTICRGRTSSFVAPTV